MPSGVQITAHMFFQIAVILTACRLVGFVLRRFGQTKVVSEMITGVMLGPSLLGALAPDLQQWLFPKTLALGAGAAMIVVTHPSMTGLYVLSQVGLVLYMFCIGLQFDTALIARHASHAGIISVTGIVVPVIFGGALGMALAGDTRLFATEIVPWQGGLFIAAAMAITAFPMLARIIAESGLSHTRIGTLTLGAAACDDACAWAMLAIVLASTQQAPHIALLAIGGGLAYLLAMLFVGRPLLARLAGRLSPEGEIDTATLVLILQVVAVAAWFTDMVGIYAVFGAFVAGVALPRGDFANAVRRQIERLTVALLLPLFFVYSGLNTQIGLLVEPSLFWVAVLICAVAFVCKGGGCALATRLGGASWREAGMVGVLMNARGLMELLLANIGLEQGLISPALFTMLVIMATVTTFVASPLFQLLWRPTAARPVEEPAVAVSS